MFKTIFIACLLGLLLGSAACDSQHPWVRVVVDKHAEALMPSRPQVIGGASEHQPMQLFSVKDDQALYQIVRLSIRDSSLSLEVPQSRQDFYNGFAKMLLLAQQNSRLVRRTSFSTAVGEGMELEFTAIHQGTGQPVTKYCRSLLIGRVGYSFIFIPHQSLASHDQQADERRRRFFSSIACK